MIVNKIRRLNSGIFAAFWTPARIYLFLNLAANSFDLLSGRAAHLVDNNGECMLQLTVAKNFDKIIILGDKTCSNQSLFVNPGISGKTLEILKIDNGKDFLEDIVKAPLWQTTLKRHLAAFKSQLDAAAGTSFVSFVTTSCCLAMTGTKTPAYALSRLS
jgi:hypothetical protein